MSDHLTPDVMPVLSRGKHRNARKGACFMEMTSYLAGERWSDHPDCTHPLLAALAREVNDHVGDDARQQLAPMIPTVIGLNGEDPRVDAWISLEAALAALPIASLERQRVAAVGVLRCERHLNSVEGRPAAHVSARSTAALTQVPHAREWAERFTQVGFGRPGTFRRRSAPNIIHCSVSGIAHACIDDPDAAMVALLRDTIAKCQTWLDVPSLAAAAQIGAAVPERTRLGASRAG